MFLKLLLVGKAKMAEVKLERQIGDLEVFLTGLMPFDKGLKAISRAGGQLAPAQRVAQARLVAPREHSLWQNGSWANENLVYVPAGYVEGEQSPFVLWTSGQHSPIPKYAPQATQAHRDHKEFYVPESDFEAILKQARADTDKPPAAREVLLDNRVDAFEAAAQKLGADQLMQFVFKGDLGAYAARLTKFEVPSVLVYLAGVWHTNAQEQPFARALWLHDVDGGLSSDFRGSYYGSRARGVRRVAPATAYKRFF